MTQGYIKLHRGLLGWEWFDSPKHLIVFMYCLLRANHKDRKWRGTLIKAGSFVTSYESIAKCTNLTLNQVRIALRDLQDTQEITKQSSRKGSIISITNWHKYQVSHTQDTQDRTIKAQSKHSKITSNKNDNNDNNVKEIISFLNSVCSKSFKHTTSKTRGLVNARLAEGFDLDDFKRVIKIKSSQWLNDEQMNGYLRPETLFGSKFESYLNENPTGSEAMPEEDIDRIIGAIK
jgi:uncharacterized phage protein (TIGR02220 family)